MNEMKGKLLDKLKAIRPIIFLKQDHVLQVKASDGYAESLTYNSGFIPQTPIVSLESEPRKFFLRSEKDPEIIDVSELMRDLEDDEMDLDDENDDKENTGSFSRKSKDGIDSKKFTENAIKLETELRQSLLLETSRLSEPSADDNHRRTPTSDINIMSFRRPDLNSCSLFDPNLLAAFEQAVKEHFRMTEVERTGRDEEISFEYIEEEPPPKSRRIEEDNPLLSFIEKCPPGGIDSVILYTTTLRGIRKTFEDCNRIRFLLDSFRVLYFERDVSMHVEFKEELWRTLEGKTVPPRLFVKGRYIGGAEHVLSLHEQGKLRPLFEGAPVDRSRGPCEACVGFRFVLCINCNGSRKVIEENRETSQCPRCNENGLLICPHCC